MKLSSNGDLLGGNRISSGASVRKQSNRLIEQSADKVIQAVVDKFKEDEDIQNLLRHHSIIAANLEEKMKDLIAATTRIEDLEKEEQRLEDLVKKYIKADYTMPAAVNIISTEIQDNSKALRDMSSSSNQNSGLLMLMG